MKSAIICECVIGTKNDELITFDELKECIKREKEFQKRNKELWEIMGSTYTLSDYCDRRKSTDLFRFEYCPLCGKKIDWKSYKEMII